MTAHNPDTIRKSIIDDMQAHNRRMKNLIIAAAILEAALIFGAIALTIWKDPLHRVIIASAIGTWLLTGIGLILLGAHVSRVGQRIIAALTPDG